jgi:hypothetical protein
MIVYSNITGGIVYQLLRSPRCRQRLELPNSRSSCLSADHRDAMNALLRFYYRVVDKPGMSRDIWAAATGSLDPLNQRTLLLESWRPRWRHIASTIVTLAGWTLCPSKSWSRCGGHWVTSKIYDLSPRCKEQQIQPCCHRVDRSFFAHYFTLRRAVTASGAPFYNDIRSDIIVIWLRAELLNSLAVTVFIVEWTMIHTRKMHRW